MADQLKVNICDILIQYNFEGVRSASLNLGLFKNYSVEKDMEITLKKVKEISFPNKGMCIPPFKYSYYNDGEYNYVWNIQGKRSLMKCSREWNNATISTTINIDNITEENLLLTAVQSRLSYLNGFMMHGSVISYKGNGIIFTAGCGVGKSTQANLWREHEGAEIINGDKAFIRYYQKETKVYGSLWSGSSPYVKNIKVPLKAIVVLEQSKENKIRKLSEFEAIELFGTHVYYPYWDKNIMSLVLDTVGLIIKEVPIYLLSCRPDKEAVDLLKNKIFS